MYQLSKFGAGTDIVLFYLFIFHLWLSSKTLFMALFFKFKKKKTQMRGTIIKLQATNINRNALNERKRTFYGINKAISIPSSSILSIYWNYYSTIKKIVTLYSTIKKIESYKHLTVRIKWYTKFFLKLSNSCCLIVTLSKWSRVYQWWVHTYIIVKFLKYWEFKIIIQTRQNR